MSASGQSRPSARAPFALALFVVLAAQDVPADLHARILAKDDAEFAVALSRAGYPDLAEDVLLAIEKAGSSEGRLRSELLRLELEQDRALREPDATKRLALLEGLIESRSEFARAHAGTPEGERVLGSQQELYQSVGQMITQLIEEKGVTSETEPLRKRGIELLEQVNTTLKERLDQFDAQSSAALTPEQQAEHDFQRMVTAYGLARTNYFRSLLFDVGSFERSILAKKALDILLDFQLEYPDQLLCYEGFIYEALCHKALENTEKALESFDAAIALRETYEQRKNGIYEMSPEAADIVSSAVHQKMLLQTATGDHAGAVATAKDFFDTTVEPWTTFKGLAVLSQQAEAYKALGDQASLAATAKRMIDVDPYGSGGHRGRELLGGGEGGGSSTLGAAELLKLAESSAGREPERSMALCQQVMALARGTAERANLGSRAGLLLGALLAQKGSLHDAVVAYHTTADRYPDGKDAPECLWRAINGYLTLQGQERRSLYKTLAQELLTELSARYPQHAYASSAGLIEGQQAEAEEDFVRAASIYERIPPGSAGHEEGLYRAGNAWLRQTRKLAQEGKTAEVKDAAQRCEALLTKARAALDAAGARTLETSTQDRMRGFSFGARIGLANLFLLESVNRAAEVVPLFQGIESELSKDAVRMSMVWDLRFRSLRAQGKLDEAIALLDAHMRQDPSAVWLESGASALAPILDKRAQELFRADPSSSEGGRLWSKAASYYRLAIAGQLEGREAIQIDQLEGVADRLFVFGLHAEGVPDNVQTFVDRHGKPLSNELLELAVRAYETVLPLTPSHRTVIKLARTLGFLGRWEEAAARYAELFERERFSNPATKTIDQASVAAKPELLFAYIEWGSAERELGLAQGDMSRLIRASGIFETLVLGTLEGSKLWWQAKLRQLETLVDRGEYEVADVALDGVQLKYEHFDGGEHGLEPRFVELRERLATKVFRK